MPADPNTCPDKLAEEAALGAVKTTDRPSSELGHCPECGLTCLVRPDGTLPPHPAGGHGEACPVGTPKD